MTEAQDPKRKKFDTTVQLISDRFAAQGIYSSQQAYHHDAPRHLAEGAKSLKGHEDLLLNLVNAHKAQYYSSTGKFNSPEAKDMVAKAKQAVTKHMAKHYGGSVNDEGEIEGLEEAEKHRIEAVVEGAKIHVIDHMRSVMPAIRKNTRREMESLKEATTIASYTAEQIKNGKVTDSQERITAYKDLNTAIDNFHMSLEASMKQLPLDELDRQEVTVRMSGSRELVTAKKQRTQLFELLTDEEKSIVTADRVEANKKKIGQPKVKTNMQKALEQFRNEEHLKNTSQTPLPPSAKKEGSLSR